MSRTTKKQVQGVFEILCKALGKRVAKDYKDHGAWGLEYNAAYGGWRIYELLAGDGENTPMGDIRRSSSEFWDACHFALRALDHVKK